MSKFSYQFVVSAVLILASQSSFADVCSGVDHPVFSCVGNNYSLCASANRLRVVALIEGGENQVSFESAHLVSPDGDRNYYSAYTKDVGVSFTPGGESGTPFNGVLSFKDSASGVYTGSEDVSCGLN